MEMLFFIVAEELPSVAETDSCVAEAHLAVADG
jgi:hypothetical protein